MKCPHCNQEHPEGTKFCSETGKPMLQLCRCPNPQCVNYMKSDLSEAFKYCPECGMKLLGEGTKPVDEYKFDPRKGLSSLEDFQHGNIIVDGIILGRSPISELKRFKKDWYNKEYTSYRLLEGNAHVSGELLDDVDKVIGYSEQIDSQLVLSLKDKVSNIYFYNWEKVPFLKEMGLSEHYVWLGDENEKSEIVKLFEQNGYVRIEPPVPNDGVDDDTDSKGLLFISAKPNGYGHYILIDCSPNCPLDINVNILSEWTTYYDGIKHTL